MCRILEGVGVGKEGGWAVLGESPKGPPLHGRGLPGVSPRTSTAASDGGITAADSHKREWSQLQKSGHVSRGA